MFFILRLLLLQQYMFSIQEMLKVNVFSSKFSLTLYILFVDCDEGRYGMHCQYNCSRHCREEFHCYHINGSCLDGCAPGYDGPFCNICKYIFV